MLLISIKLSDVRDFEGGGDVFEKSEMSSAWVETLASSSDFSIF